MRRRQPGTQPPATLQAASAGAGPYLARLQEAYAPLPPSQLV